MKRDSVVFYRSFYEAIKNLPDKERLESLQAIFDYAFDGTMPTGAGVAMAMFLMAKPKIDRDMHFEDTQKERRSAEYKDWRKKVLERDGYICRRCGRKDEILHAHHLKKFSEYPELRFDVDNGITLCEKCHLEVHRNEK